MKIKHKNKNLMVSLLFVTVLALFIVAAFFEYQRSYLEQKNDLQGHIQILTSRISSYINATINHSEGIVSFIETYPELDQDDFSDYVSKVADNEISIVSHHVAIKDTTIAFTYPLEGKESSIGVDLLTIDDQREGVLKVKNENTSLLVGPVELVEGGRYLINRMPITIQNKSETYYWGQLSTIIKFEELLERAGINEYAKDNYILIEYLDDLKDSRKLIYTNSRKFTEDKIKTVIDIPNGKWEITIESKGGYTVFTPVLSVLLITGFLIAFVTSALLRYILNVNENLNGKVELRTHDIRKINVELGESLKELRATQDQLINREKHAAMGELVAGVAHEINTPLGVSITATSYLNNLSEGLDRKLSDNTLKKSELKDGLENLIESSQIVSINLERASALINSFKKLSSDQHQDEKKYINLKDYLDYIIRAVSPTYRGTKHKIHCPVDEDMMVMVYPGALSQVMTILLMNSLIHGFEGIDTGKVIIKAHIDHKALVIDYFDNGVGISSDIGDKVFNPFYTTKRSAGNTGLGLNIAFNIMTQQFKGSISLNDDIETGVHFKMRFPIK